MTRAAILKNLTGDPGRVTIALGVVTDEPADRLDAVGVALASRPDHTIAVTPHWNRDGDTLPSAGAECTLALSPGVDPVVLTWTPDA